MRSKILLPRSPIKILANPMPRISQQSPIQMPLIKKLRPLIPVIRSQNKSPPNPTASFFDPTASRKSTLSLLPQAKHNILPREKLHNLSRRRCQFSLNQSFSIHINEFFPQSPARHNHAMHRQSIHQLVRKNAPPTKKRNYNLE